MSKKLIAIALAGLFAFSAVSVKADTLSDLQATIASLTAQIAALQAQVTAASGGTTGVCFETDLQKGMTSNDVKNLQIKLGVTPTSGYFGTITLAAVKTFQTAHGIINTGYVGPLTRAALNILYCVAVTPVTTYPAGCTSAVGFSTTTGLSCSAAVTYPAGCTSAVGFSPTTGLSCAGVVTYPAGCTSAVGFSPTTGLSCAGTTPVGPAYGTLSVVTYPVSNPQTTLYGANTYETVAGQYKATGSDITVRKVAVKITSSGATAFPWQAFSAISVWDGSTQLAELPVTSANAIENTWANIYTFNLSGFNWVIPNGTQKVLTVKVTTVASPVTAATNLTWTVSLLTDVVYSDTAGVTYSTASGTAITTGSLTLAAAQSSTITVTAATDNPLAGNVIGSTSATTKVDVLKFNVKAADVNATFNTGTIKVTTAGAISTSDAYVTSLELWDGSTLVAAAAPTGWASNVGTSTWSNFSLPIAAGTTKILTVKAVLAQLPSTYAGASTSYLSITTGPSLSGIDANSNVVTAAGTTVTGNNQYPFIVAPTFAYVAHSVTIKDSSTSTINNIGDTSITFSVTANGGDIYIPAVSNTTTTLGIDESVTPAYVAADHHYSTSTTWTCSSPAVSVADTGAGVLWRVSSGATANCTLSTLITNTVAGVPASTTVGYFSVAVEHAKWYSTATSTAPSYINQSWGLTNINTADFYLSK